MVSAPLSAGYPLKVTGSVRSYTFHTEYRRKFWTGVLRTLAWAGVRRAAFDVDQAASGLFLDLQRRVLDAEALPQFDLELAEDHVGVGARLHQHVERFLDQPPGGEEDEHRDQQADDRVDDVGAAGDHPGARDHDPERAERVGEGGAQGALGGDVGGVPS